MNFSKTIQLSQQANGFQQIQLTRAQIEQLKNAGKSALLEEKIRNLFHISTIRSERVLAEDTGKIEDVSEDTERELQAGGPVFFVLSVKEGQLSEKSAYLYAGMMMAHMQLQATDIQLGYTFHSEQEKVNILSKNEWKSRLHIPRDFSPIQILKIGYPTVPINEREPYLGSSTLKSIE